MPEIQMPKLSDTMTEGTLVAWKKKKGDKVSAGEVLAEIETDKATMEWEAPEDGMLTEIYVEEGGKVNVGDKIAFIDGEDEEAPKEEAPAEKEEKKLEEAKAKEKEPENKEEKKKPEGREEKEATAEKKEEKKVDKKPEAKAEKPAPKIDKGEEARVKASPVARRIAAELGVDLSRVNGTGPEGRVTEPDVRAAVKVPRVNASFDGDAFVQYADVDLGIAVAIEDGLLTPVIRAAQNKSLREISELAKDLAHRARSKRMKPEEFQGGTFTVSNLGGMGIDSFFAIINPPQGFILSVGLITRTAVIDDSDQIVVGHRMNIGMSCDHRVIDGALGAEYLKELRHLLENPALLLV